MMYGNTLRYAGKKGIKFVTRKEDGFVQVAVDTENGEHVLEFSPALFATLTEAFKGVAAGKNYDGLDPARASAIVKPDVFLHVDEEKVEIGFEERDDYNPVAGDWPAIVIQNKDLYLNLCLSPAQAKILMDRCRQLVALGAAVEDCASGMLEEKNA